MSNNNPSDRIEKARKAAQANKERTLKEAATAQQQYQDAEQVRIAEIIAKLRQEIASALDREAKIDYADAIIITTGSRTRLFRRPQSVQEPGWLIYISETSSDFNGHGRMHTSTTIYLLASGDIVLIDTSWRVKIIPLSELAKSTLWLDKVFEGLKRLGQT